MVLSLRDSPPGLFGSHFLDETQMQWTPAGDGTEGCHARSPTEVNDRLLEFWRPSRVCPCRKSVIGCPTTKVVSCRKGVTMCKSLGELAREVERVQGQPAVKEEDSGTRDENEPLLVPRSARVVSGRRHHRLCMRVDLLMCRNGRSEEFLGRSSNLYRSARFILSTTSKATVLQSHIPTMLRSGN